MDLSTTKRMTEPESSRTAPPGAQSELARDKKRIVLKALLLLATAAC